MLKKKAQEFSIQIIIIAAICVLVLVAIVILFVSKSNKFNNDVSRCDSVGGVCTSAKNCKGVQFDAKCTISTKTAVTGRVWTYLIKNPVCCIEIE